LQGPATPKPHNAGAGDVPAYDPIGETAYWANPDFGGASSLSKHRIPGWGHFGRWTPISASGVAELIFLLRRNSVSVGIEPERKSFLWSGIPPELRASVLIYHDF